MSADNQIQVKLFYPIMEVAKMIGVSTSTLRYWEQQTSVLRPRKSKSGARSYSRNDIKVAQQLYRYTHELKLPLDYAETLIRRGSDVGEEPAKVVNTLKKVRESLVELLNEL